MATTYEQFRASLGNSLTRRALGIKISDHEADRVVRDENLCRAYYASWSAIPHPQLGGYASGVVPPTPASAPAVYPRAQVPPPHVFPAFAAPVCETVPPPKRRMGCCSAIALFFVIGALILGALVTVANLGASSDGSSSISFRSTSEAPPPPDPNAVSDKHAADNGWHVLISGDLYVKAAEPGSFTCGYSNCLWYSLTSLAGCPGGVYVQADVLNDGTAFDWTNTITASIAAGETIQFQLESMNDNADEFRITEAQCTS